MRYNILYSCISHIGKVRNMNQDNFICNGQVLKDAGTDEPFVLQGVSSSQGTPLFAVFDGMGGEECGEVAARIAAETASCFELQTDGVQALKKYCTEANDAICRYADKHGITAMGTTAAMLLFANKEILLCNIGDSKIFQISSGELRQISKDHIGVAVFGKKPPLSQNLGIPPADMIIDPFISRGAYHVGDRYLICSDGLTDMVTTDEIVAILKNNSISAASQSLLARALENGGRDNITLILLEIKKTSIFSSLKKKVEGKKI